MFQFYVFTSFTKLPCLGLLLASGRILPSASTQVETSTITSTQLPSPAGPALTHFHHFPSPCWEACFGPSSLPQGSPLTPASLPIHSTVADKCHFLLQSSDSISFQFRNIPSSLCPLPPHMREHVCLCLLLQGLSCLLPPHCNLPTHGLGLHHLYPTPIPTPGKPIHPSRVPDVLPAGHTPLCSHDLLLHFASAPASAVITSALTLSTGALILNPRGQRPCPLPLCSLCFH